MKFDGLSLHSFPLSLDPASYQTDLYLSDETFTILENDKVLQSKITSISLEFEGIGTTSCVIKYVDQLIRCDIPLNSDSTKRKVKIWLILNGSLRFDV